MGIENEKKICISVHSAKSSCNEIIMGASDGISECPFRGSVVFCLLVVFLFSFF